MNPRIDPNADRTGAAAPGEPTEVTRQHSVQPEQRGEQNDMPRKARDLMKIGVRTVDRNASIYDAIRILVEHRISGMPVMDGRRLVGIITEKDILELVFNKQRLPGPVEQYMTRQVVTFDEEEDVTKIWSCLVRNSYRRVPILRNGKLTGIVTRADLLRARFGDLCARSSGRAPGPLADEPCVLEVMTPGLLTTTPEAPVIDAIELLLANEITGLPVVDDAMRLLGILSERDVLKLFDGDHPQAWHVRDIMTSDVISFNVGDSLFQVCECLARNSFRRVPVLDRGKLVGIVSRADIIMYLLKNRSILSEGRTVSCACNR
jgi:CBS domain-containing protein